MKKFIAALIPLFFCSLPLSGADDVDFIAVEKKFIRSLYSEKRYFESIAEARRLQAVVQSPELDYFIYMNYYLAGQYRTVAERYDYMASHLGIGAGSLVSESYLKLGMYGESYRALSAYTYSGDSKKDMELFLRRTAPLILSGDVEGLEREELSAQSCLRDDYNFISLREELSRFRGEGLKSPLKAALLSAAVPGLGQVYTGYIGEGIISLASVAATALGGVYLHNRGRDGYSCALFFFSGLFYAGNIYGAWNSAERRNRAIVRDEQRLINSRYGEYNPESCIDVERLLH